jgi:hypothetical protein
MPTHFAADENSITTLTQLGNSPRGPVDRSARRVDPTPAHLFHSNPQFANLDWSRSCILIPSGWNWILKARSGMGSL